MAECKDGTANPFEVQSSVRNDQSFLAKASTPVAVRKPVMEVPPKVKIAGLAELPEFWWELADAEQVGYNNRTRAKIAAALVEVMLDRGATRNSVTEELIVGMINHCHTKGMTTRSKD